MAMKLPDRVTICEVGPRDGFQIEPNFIPTELKVEVVTLLAEAGVPRIEVTSFVHPKVVPQLRDAEEVMAKIRRRPGTRYAALVPNDKGAVRAVDAGVDAIHTVVSASESHNLANVNMTIAESIEKLRAVMQVAERARVPVACGISTSFGCPFETAVPIPQVESVVRRRQRLHGRSRALPARDGRPHGHRPRPPTGGVAPRSGRGGAHAARPDREGGHLGSSISGPRRGGRATRSPACLDLITTCRGG